MSDSAFQAEHISRSFGKRQILSDCSLHADKGDCIGIAGRNGSGKSTLLSILAGIRKPSSGTVTCFGRNLLQNRKEFGRLIGYVPQTNPLIEELSVLDNLKLLTGSRVPEMSPVLESLSVKELLRTKVSDLSGGMKRRAAIAAALLPGPPVLIMDEPTSALDLYHKSAIYDNLKTYRESGGILIMATHDQEEMALCSRLYLIEHGTARETTAEAAVSRIRGNITVSA